MLLFTTCSLFLSHWVTWAHGPAPAVLGPPNGIHANTDLIRLSSGFAVQDERGEWRYMCPAMWGGPRAPLIVSDDQGMWILGSDRLKLWTGAWSTPRELSNGSVLEFTNLDGRAWALVHLEDQAELVSLDSRSRYSLSEAFTELITAEFRLEGNIEKGFVLARAENGMVSVLWIDPVGQELNRWSRSLTDELSEETGEVLIGLDLRPLEDHIYLELTLTERNVLMSLDALIDGEPIPTLSLSEVEASTNAVSSPYPIIGPISWNETRLIMSGGELYTWSEDGQLSRSELQVGSDTEPHWTCLNAFHLCTVQELFALPSSIDDPLTQLFAHFQLKAPLEEHVSPEQWSLCQTEWFDYAIHAGINPSLSRSDELSEFDVNTDNANGLSDMGCYTQQSSFELESASNLAVIIFGIIIVIITTRCKRIET